MNESSFEKFNYALRPAKNMERKMLCECFARFSRIAKLSSYKYIGFGAIGFHDFCLFHQRLGIRDMVSIEGNTSAQKRVEFNIPYSCIKMKWGMSDAVLPVLKWNKRVILWLDYERPLTLDKLKKDIAFATQNMLSGSAIVVTVPADPGPPNPDVDMAAKRLADLRSSVGKDYLPEGLTGEMLSKWGLAAACRQIIFNCIEKTLNNRNAALTAADRVKYHQLFHFHYADGVKMMTTGGLVLNANDSGSLGKRQFKDLAFYKPSSDAYLIETPVLTMREIKYLDERLPRSGPKVLRPEWIPEKERVKYGQVYRYYPSFNEVET